MKTTARKSSDSESKMVYWMPPLSMETLENSSQKVMPKHIKEWLMSLPPDSPVSHSQSQESKKANQTKEICGRQLGMPYALYDQDTSMVKMSQVSLFRDISGESSVIFTKSGMMLNGRCYRQPTAGHLIKGQGSGYLLPTPSATPYGSNRGGTDKNDPRGWSRKGKTRHSLNSMAKTGMWPTPANRDYRSEACSDDFRHKRESHSRGKPLSWRVKWPTPTDSMVTVGDMEQARFAGNDPRRPKYEDAKGDAKQGQLNPDWVEWLMQWPIGWSSLEPLKELIWLSWEVDPADMEQPINYPTPRKTEVDASKTAQGIHGFNVIAKDGREWGINLTTAVKLWPTPRAGNPGSRPNLKGGKILAEEAKKIQTMGPIPRVAIGIKDRVNRLKAIGNGQVPICAATAWELKPR